MTNHTSFIIIKVNKSMALRTFHLNPSLGGFGGESTNLLLSESIAYQKCIADPEHPAVAAPSVEGSGDAFSQIIKELVDNAVDACTSSKSVAEEDARQRNKRVRVVIEPYNAHGNIRKGEQSDEEEGATSHAKQQDVLRVTVTDNGCGMEDIEACVHAFRTNKSRNVNHTKGEEGTELAEEKTGGRYGIGLTLCLLHAQRLVPNSCASIRSATTDQSQWTSTTCVVDTLSDSIRCLRTVILPKNDVRECGTSISLLVPGEPTATLAWPRLAEYFARFKLSLGLACSMEVMAPTLSRVPLFIKVNSERGVIFDYNKENNKMKVSEDERDRNVLLDTESSSNDSMSRNIGWTAGLVKLKRDEQASVQGEELWKAAQRYCGQMIPRKNVASMVVPIRLHKKNKNSAASCRREDAPKLEVSLVVQGPDDGTEDGVIEVPDAESVGMHNNQAFLQTQTMNQEQTSASMVLVRMINRIPILDSAESVACGLYQGLASKTNLWHSFGLSVTPTEPFGDGQPSLTKMLKFCVQDSAQLAPFLRGGGHDLLQEDPDEPLPDEKEEDTSINSYTGSLLANTGKRKKKARQHRLLPAHERLGKMLVVVEVHARPSVLPLPTLSKGRLPVDNQAIDNALETGLMGCLRQLQASNPSLFLTSAELRKTERDTRYIPAVAEGLAASLRESIRGNSKGRTADLLEKIRKWKFASDHSESDADDAGSKPGGSVWSEETPVEASQNYTIDPDRPFSRDGDEHDDFRTVGHLIEVRFRQVLERFEAAARNPRDGQRPPPTVESDEEESIIGNDILEKADDDLSVLSEATSNENMGEDRLLVEQMLSDLGSSEEEDQTTTSRSLHRAEIIPRIVPTEEEYDFEEW